eukprot:30763_1
MEGSTCKVYSESQDKWFDGEISKILDHGHVRVHYGDDMEKDIHIDNKYIKISQQTAEKQKKGRKVYWAEGMSIETYVDEYNDWITGTITKVHNNTHSIDIHLNTQQDTQNIGNIHVNGTHEQSKIRPNPDPIVNISSKSPKQSILKNPSPVRRSTITQHRHSNDSNTTSEVHSQSLEADEEKVSTLSRRMYTGPAIPVEDLPIIERLARGAPLSTRYGSDSQQDMNAVNFNNYGNNKSEFSEAALNRRNMMSSDKHLHTYNDNNEPNKLRSGPPTASSNVFNFLQQQQNANYAQNDTILPNNNTIDSQQQPPVIAGNILQHYPNTNRVSVTPTDNFNMAQFQAAEVHYDNTNDNNNNNSIKMCIILLIVFLLLSGLGIGLFFLLRNKPTKATVKPTIPATTHMHHTHGKNIHHRGLPQNIDSHDDNIELRKRTPYPTKDDTQMLPGPLQIPDEPAQIPDELAQIPDEDEKNLMLHIHVHHRRMLSSSAYSNWNQTIIYVF